LIFTYCQVLASTEGDSAAMLEDTCIVPDDVSTIDLSLFPAAHHSHLSAHACAAACSFVSQTSG
jgi:hypothetical protein